MKTLSKEEKEIIRLIQKKEITDIYSYVKYFNLGKEVQQFHENIKKEFDKKFEGKTYTIKQPEYDFLENKCIVEKLDNNMCKAKPFLSYEDNPEKQAICYNGKQITHFYNLTEPTYICEDIEKILNFISIWQFLESEHLIIELPKSCEKQDMALFLEQISYDYVSEDYFLNFAPQSIYEMKFSAASFMDWRFSLNIHNFEICLPYLQKQIQPTLGLDTFVEKGFKTKSDLIERRNFIIALAGVIVAIVTSGASLIMSFLDNGNTEELNKINNSLQEIRQELNLPEENIEQQTTQTEESIQQ